MRPMLALLALTALLSGCAERTGGNETLDRDDTSLPYPPVDDEYTPDGPTITITAEPATLSETVTVTGTVEWPTNLTIEVIGRTGPTSEQALFANGTWTADVALGLGDNQVVARSDMFTAAALEVVRLTTATLQVVYTAYPAHADIEDIVEFNVHARPTASDYTDTDIQHPDAFTVHDLLSTWSAATGIPVEYEYFSGLGYGPVKFDGVGQPISSDAPPWWCMKVNGETADFGASILEVMPGDVITWEYGSCVA